MMKKLLFIVLGFGSLNALAVNPTQGPLQQNPALCSYGYNPNCNQGNTPSPKKIINTTIIHVPSKYGAYAINKKTGIGGGAIEMNSLAEAKREAIKKCENGGRNAPCTVIKWVRNGCLAGAKGYSGKLSRAFYTSGVPGQAEPIAMNMCKNAGVSQCEIFIPEACSVPEGMYD